MTSQIEKLNKLLQYPEFLDVVDVLFYGVKKGYDDENWLRPDGNTCSLKDNSASIFRHLAQYGVGNNIDESGLDHRLHIACRALMSYTRNKRGVIHPKDSISVTINKKTISLKPGEILVEFNGAGGDSKYERKHLGENRKPNIDDSNCTDINTHIEKMKKDNSQYYYGTPDKNDK